MATESHQVVCLRGHGIVCGDIQMLRRATALRGLHVLSVDQATEEDVLQYASMKARGLLCDTSLPLKVFAELGTFCDHEVAIVSWRWDLDRDIPSRNLTRVLRLAKRDHIRYLFIDILSIDQSLPPDDLMQQVINYAQLYRQLPVVTAYYDAPPKASYEIHGNVIVTMTRPWILFEIKRFHNSPHKIHYTLEEGDDHSCRDSDGLATRMAYVANTDYALSIARELNGLTNSLHTMKSISDFQYLLPEDAGLICTAYERMNPPDYLLTVLLLSFSSRQIPKHTEAGEAPRLVYNIQSETSDLDIIIERCSSHVRYAFRAKPEDSKVELLLLDGQLIGTVSKAPRFVFHTLHYEARMLIDLALARCSSES